MKPGIARIKERARERQESFVERRSVGAAVMEPEHDAAVSSTPLSELEDFRWSVVSFDKSEAGGMTYAQASRLISELEFRGVAGLCLVTDEAAARIRG